MILPAEHERKESEVVRLFATPWPVAHQAPPYMDSSRQEDWSGLPFPFLGDLPDPGIEPRSRQHVTEGTGGNDVAATLGAYEERAQGKRD